MEKRAELDRGLTLVELLVLLVIVGMLLALLIPAKGPPPPLTDNDLDLTSWDSSAEKTIRPPPDILAPDVNLIGEWQCGSRRRIALNIEPDRSGEWRITFHSGTGCGLGRSISLKRVATYGAGIVTLDRPVQEVLGETFQRLYTVRVHGREYIIPSVRLDKLTKILGDGDPKDQTDALQWEMLVRQVR
jgi:hypothetical protein